MFEGRMSKNVCFSVEKLALSQRWSDDLWIVMYKIKIKTNINFFSNKVAS